MKGGPTRKLSVLRAIEENDGLTSKELSAELHIDPGYSSSILRRYHSQGLLSRKPEGIKYRYSLAKLGQKKLDYYSKK